MTNHRSRPDRVIFAELPGELGGFLRFCPEGAVEFHRAAIAEGWRYIPMPPTDDVIDAEWRRD